MAQAQPLPQRRVALVIGNATYTNGGVLDNPEADADAVAGRLQELGFEVTTDKNLGQSGMRDLIGGFMSRVRDGDLVLIYYAGHGVEVDGRDYMLPVDVKLETPAAVQFQGIALDMLYSGRETFGVVIVFDACRDNPFIRRVKGEVAGTHALSPPVGALVLFSASSGDVAEDGGVDAEGGTRKNSVFASAFTRALSDPDASIQRIYQTILRDVRSQTSNRQAPQRFGDLAEDFIFNPTNRVFAAAAPSRPSAYAAVTPPPAPTQFAANTAPPSGSTFRSMPTTESSTPPASEPATVAAYSAPPPSPAPQPAPPAPRHAAAVEPGPAAAAPAPAQPQVMAALTPAASSGPPSTATIAAPAAPLPRPAAPSPTPAVQAPAAPMTFTIASLGENVLPPAPQLQTVPNLALPARFCSVQEQIDYLNKTFRPAYEIAYRNNEVAVAYLGALNALGAEYSARGSGFVFRIKSQFEAFAPAAAQANTQSNDVLALDARIRQIPVQACAG